MTIKNKYLLPRIDDLFDSFLEKRPSIRLPPVKGEAEDILKTTFWTCYGHYEFLVMSFGLMNTLAVFMKLINNVNLTYIITNLIVGGSGEIEAYRAFTREN